MFIWSIKCESEYFFWFCLFFDSGNRKQSENKQFQQKMVKIFFFFSIFGRRSACFKEYLEVWLKLYRKLLQEGLQITFRHYKTNMADEAAHTGSGRLRKNKITKLSLKLGQERAETSRTETSTVSKLSWFTCLSLRCRLFADWRWTPQRSSSGGGEASAEEEASPWRPGQMFVTSFVYRTWSVLCSSVKGSFSNISSELQDPNSSTDH